MPAENWAFAEFSSFPISKTFTSDIDLIGPELATIRRLADHDA